MDVILIQLNILIDGIAKKRIALESILNISQNQQTVIKSGMDIDAVRKMVFEMNVEKQAMITVVRECDDMFEAVLKKYGAQIDARGSVYAAQVRNLQAGIRTVMDFDLRIRATEEENNKLLDILRDGDAASAVHMNGTAAASGVGVHPIAAQASAQPASEVDQPTPLPVVPMSTQRDPTQKKAALPPNPGLVARAYMEGTKILK